MASESDTLFTMGALLAGYGSDSSSSSEDGKGKKKDDTVKSTSTKKESALSNLLGAIADSSDDDDDDGDVARDAGNEPSGSVTNETNPQRREGKKVQPTSVVQESPAKRPRHGTATGIRQLPPPRTSNDSSSSSMVACPVDYLLSPPPPPRDDVSKSPFNQSSYVTDFVKFRELVASLSSSSHRSWADRLREQPEFRNPTWDYSEILQPLGSQAVESKAKSKDTSQDNGLIS